MIYVVAARDRRGKCASRGDGRVSRSKEYLPSPSVGYANGEESLGLHGGVWLVENEFVDDHAVDGQPLRVSSIAGGRGVVWKILRTRSVVVSLVGSVGLDEFRVALVDVVSVAEAVYGERVDAADAREESTVRTSSQFEVGSVAFTKIARLPGHDDEVGGVFGVKAEQRYDEGVGVGSARRPRQSRQESVLQVICAPPSLRVARDSHDAGAETLERFEEVVGGGAVRGFPVSSVDLPVQNEQGFARQILQRLLAAQLGRSSHRNITERVGFHRSNDVGSTTTTQSCLELCRHALQLFALLHGVLLAQFLVQRRRSAAAAAAAAAAARRHTPTEALHNSAVVVVCRTISLSVESGTPSL